MLISRKISATALIFAFIITLFNVKVCADDAYDIIIDSMTVDKTGSCEIIGHIANAPIDTQIACIVARESLFDGDTLTNEEFNTENVAWIDQIGTGNNGTFLIQFNVNKRFSETTLAVRLGSAYTEVFSSTIYIPLLPPGIEIVENNSVIYGRDAFYVQGAFYTPDNIAEAIVYGGNNIYFKLGDCWYDLMNSNAVDNSFLVKENATADKEIEALMPRYYYSMLDKIELKYS